MNNKIKHLPNGDFEVLYEDKQEIEVDLMPILIEALKELNLKVEALRARVEQLENEGAI